MCYTVRMSRTFCIRLLSAGAAAWLAVQPLSFVIADTTDDAGDASIKSEVDTLSAQVKDKEARIANIKISVDRYKKQIQEHEAQVNSLTNQVALLENRIEERRLGIEQTEQEIDLLTLEVERAGNQITLQQHVIEKREAALGDVLGRLREADGVTLFDAFLARPSLSEFFTRVDELERVQADLTDITKTVKAQKQELEVRRADMESKKKDLGEHEKSLIAEQGRFSQEVSAKSTLITLTQNKEEEFQRIIRELRQQQQQEADDLATLQGKLKDSLNSTDEALARGDVLLNWPIPVKYISATFHDPDYPFRKFFEHPGVDLPTPVGTPVKAAAGGYVAWNRTGKQYGNYVMIIHPGGIATVYAHLSKFGAKPDTYVERGDIIGYSGGRPGDQGAGLSTGAHLHFEVRQNGIPVDPMQFLPNLE